MNKYTGTDNLEVMSLAENYNSFLERLITQHAKKTDKILDFGAGIGTFAKRLHVNGFDVSCLETDPDQANLITAYGIPTSTAISNIPDNSYDYIYSLNVLEHIEDDHSVMKELSRILKPSGTMLIYLPAMDILFSSMDRKVGHYRRYSRKTLSNLAIKTGLTINKCAYADSLGFLATLIYKLSNNTKGDLNKSSLIFYDRFVFPASRLLDSIFSRMLGKNIYAVFENKQAH